MEMNKTNDDFWDYLMAENVAMFIVSSGQAVQVHGFTYEFILTQ